MPGLVLFAGLGMLVGIVEIEPAKAVASLLEGLLLGATLAATDGAAVFAPAAVLTEAARESGAELLIVGRRGGDFVARTLLGSVSQRVVQHAPCDVLVVA